MSESAVTFRWNQNAGTGFLYYWLYVGNALGGNDLYSQFQGASLARTVTGLPTDGRTLYVRLWSRFSSGWQFNDYTYASANSVKAAIFDPLPGSTLIEGGAHFFWTEGTGADEYWLAVGRTPGGNDLYNLSQGMNLTAFVPGLPTDGTMVYVRLWTRIGASWQYNDYSFTAVGGSASLKGAITSPSPMPGILGWAWIDETGQAGYDNGDDITVGSKEEDEERKLSQVLWFENCTGQSRDPDGVPGLNGFLEHFWEPDDPHADGYNCRSPIGGGYNKGLTDRSVLLPDNGQYYDSSYRVAQYYWDHLAIPLYLAGSKDRAYYWLGRIAHLLEDATVPAHVHDQAHGVPYLKTDSYEDYFKIESSRIRTFTAKDVRQNVGTEYHVDALPISQQIWAEVHTDTNPPDLFKLFWYVAQKTQYAWSEDSNGIHVSGNDYYVTLLLERKQFEKHLWSEEGFSDEAPSVLASHLVPHAIRAVAGLYRLFWETTHPKAEIVSPAPGSTLPGGSVTFTWTAGSGVDQYWLNIGSSPGGYDLYSASQGTSLSKTVNGLPTDKRKLYVQLWSHFGGGWQFNDYVYTAADISPDLAVTAVTDPPATKEAG
ncbi:MAG TPA: hypothetical protein VJK02_00080, partial [Anaerolineales bacterium]|nr:hypothetical protein [Anaerolineales bacterium]